MDKTGSERALPVQAPGCAEGRKAMSAEVSTMSGARWRPPSLPCLSTDRLAGRVRISSVVVCLVLFCLLGGCVVCLRPGWCPSPSSLSLSLSLSLSRLSVCLPVSRSLSFSCVSCSCEQVTNPANSFRFPSSAVSCSRSALRTAPPSPTWSTWACSTLTSASVGAAASISKNTALPTTATCLAPVSNKECGTT